MLDINIRMDISYPSVEKPAQPIPVQEVPVDALVDTFIWSDPNTQYGYKVADISAGESLTVEDFRAPDTVGFGDDNIKLQKVAGTGWINRATISEVPERNVLRTSVTEDGMKVTFDDATYLVIPEPEDVFVVPSTGRWIYLLPDWETPRFDYKPRVSLGNATPATVPFWDKPEFYPLNEKWQTLLYELIRWWTHDTLTEGQLLTVWLAYTTERLWWTDNHGLAHQKADYIVGLYENNEPISVKGLGMVASTVLSPYGGTIETLDPTQDPPTLDWLITEGRHYIQQTAVVTGDRHNEKFPHVKRFCNRSMPYFLVGAGGRNRVEKGDYRVCTAGEKINIFW